MKQHRNRKRFGRRPHTRGLHLVAIFEGLKGLLVLLVGFELLTFIHRDIHLAAMGLVTHFHLNPASHYPRIFLDLSEHVTDTKLWALAIAALVYCLVRMVEAVGLWLNKSWAEWFAVLTGGIYIPVELFEVVHGVTWPKITVLAVNAIVVLYLSFVMIGEGRKMI